MARIILADDPVQTPIAQRALAEVTTLVLPVAMLCELAWLLRQGYREPAGVVADTLRRFANAEGVVVDRAALDAGLAFLDAGGDFADGVILHQGQALGGERLLTFDVRAAKIAGVPALSPY
ncbi:type II toxin-antitoxin system VapC family toxin [Sandaracinobacteroides saxicola]|uniref:Type II toxin-antitoxin system VapC family toxin n=1 Tax=Sandaracinobacteroides saxicola TaxID=2759707 RepID=A0A7G5IHT3_9SPHN|nr:type II toxin-antitoxin system VapC family toxin [Sandaracinobacteroides saxicola]QMW22925.1 type II toxin-antitoxin system VapC family toxin [Sandaracinobacteroides saxicola]